VRVRKRTKFNVWLQPSMVGKRITKATYCFRDWFKGIKRSAMQKQRRANQGTFNVRYNRYIALRVRVTYYIKPDKPFKTALSFMRKRL
jgi:hypothetical protein